MSMNKQQEMKLGHLKDIFAALSGVVSCEETLNNSMAPHIASFVEMVKGKYQVKIVKVNEKFEMLVTDCSRDYLRASVDGQANVVARVRSEGILLAINVAKPEAYGHDNIAIASALRSAAAKIEALDVELKTQTETVELGSDLELDADQAENEGMDVESDINMGGDLPEQVAADAPVVTEEKAPEAKAPAKTKVAAKPAAKAEEADTAEVAAETGEEEESEGVLLMQLTQTEELAH